MQVYIFSMISVKKWETSRLHWRSVVESHYKCLDFIQKSLPVISLSLISNEHNANQTLLSCLRCSTWRCVMKWWRISSTRSAVLSQPRWTCLRYRLRGDLGGCLLTCSRCSLPYWSVKDILSSASDFPLLKMRTLPDPEMLWACASLWQISEKSSAAKFFCVQTARYVWKKSLK